jgi:hypothetical protein
VTGEAAVARAKNAPIGRSVAIAVCSASTNAVRIARPARAATRLFGRTWRSVFAVLALRPRKSANNEATRFAT